MTRTEKAIELLKNGGRYVRGLQTDYRGIAQFQYWIEKDGCRLRGYGINTFFAVRHLLRTYHDTSTRTTFVLHTAEAPHAC